MKADLPHTGACVELALLDGGSFVGDLSRMHAGESGTFRMYNWAFYISHQGRHFLWDLGLDEVREPRAKGIIRVFSNHAHWDHSRPISHVFPNAKAYFGPGTRAACQPGHMKDPSLQWDGRFFDPEHSTEKWDELQGEWKSFGPFERALDYFGDGSFWILDAPGHMPGNVAAAARLQDGEWVMLGSDCCHSRDLLDGMREIAEFQGPGAVSMSLHTDLASAKDTIAKIRLLETNFGVHTALAHDASWLKKGTDQVLMSLLDNKMRVAAKEKIPYDEIP
ncbi:hypothetical protein G6011_02070 [Alternaria panax]|uniref:Metallo-beta-lactamase domain-containing protein n=1 Tax=Alternaria panax TaxID=48097 RepID=A0AAD4FE35_9PLEO|nr:hypothetical protein G6011_02070 [Alternaria panax]